MSNKTTVENYCEHCGAEYMITWDEEMLIDEPIFCPFCAVRVDAEELDFGEDNT